MRAFFGSVIGLALWVMLRATLLLTRLRPRLPQCSSGKAAGNGCRMLVTGRIDNKNWCLSHLVPLAKTDAVAEMLLVVDGTLTPVPKARRFEVPASLAWIKPRAIARSIWAVRLAMREKPDIIMAYCFFPAGLFSLWAARLSGAAAIVQVAGGIQEVEAGGIVAERPLIPDFLVKRLVPLWQKVAGEFDGVVVRGHRAQAYFQEHSSPRRIDVIPGSVNGSRFAPSACQRTIDIAFVGSITPRKQPDHVCEVVKRVAAKCPQLRVAIAGTGPLLPEMKRWARKLGVEKNMLFLGHVEKVEGLLTRSRVFLLTSRIEGLSIAMAEAMTAGAVPVVPAIDDLSELVREGSTGYLIQPGQFDQYAARICALLEDKLLWSKMSNQARELAVNNNGLDAVTRRWQTCLESVLRHGSVPVPVELTRAPIEASTAGSKAHS
jgi:glycosyltransferase involved in cell wall biosynthesis